MHKLLLGRLPLFQKPPAPPMLQLISREMPENAMQCAGRIMVPGAGGHIRHDRFRLMAF